MMMKRVFALSAPLLSASLLLISACTTVGPDYAAPPPIAAGTDWFEPADHGAVDPMWWNSFGDPLLARLVQRALADAPSLAEAEARLAEARASQAAVTGARLPQVNASGSAQENRISENGQFPAARIPGFPTDFSLFDLGFDASWEIDLWGRRTRAVQAAGATVEAAEASRDGVLVTLAAEVARNYAELRVAQAQIAAGRDASGARAQLARLTALLDQEGEGTAIDAETAAAQFATGSAELPLASARAAAAAFRIAALLGAPPEELAGELLSPAAIPQAADSILVGVRSDLLRRRPDIRRAERQLASATADIGVATADLFPSFSLTGGLGVQSRTPDGLFDPGALRLAIGPRFSWPVFSGGRVRAQIAAADARAAAAAARYDGAVADALADSEAAINRWLASRAAQDLAHIALARQSRAFALSSLRFDRGEDSRISLEQARLVLVNTQRLAAEADGATTIAAIALYKSLGGSWQAPA